MTPPSHGQEPHRLEPEVFLEEVHSFEFWFQAVSGYLAGRPYGHREGVTETPPGPV